MKEIFLVSSTKIGELGWMRGQFPGPNDYRERLSEKMPKCLILNHAQLLDQT
jgi:hypothetical protein